MNHSFFREDDNILYEAIKGDEEYLQRLAGVIDNERGYPKWDREAVIEVLANIIRDDASRAYNEMFDVGGPFASAFLYWGKCSYWDIAEAIYEDIAEDALGSESLRSAMSSAYGRGKEAVSKATSRSKAKPQVKKSSGKKTASKSCKSKASASKKSKGARR